MLTIVRLAVIERLCKHAVLDTDQVMPWAHKQHVSRVCEEVATSSACRLPAKSCRPRILIQSGRSTTLSILSRHSGLNIRGHYFDRRRNSCRITRYGRSEGRRCEGTVISGSCGERKQQSRKKNARFESKSRSSIQNQRSRQWTATNASTGFTSLSQASV